jgi:uncharacterized protein (DUF2141 family)
MRCLLLLTLALALAAPARAQDADSTGTLVVVVTGFDGTDGTARIRLDASQAAYDAAGDAGADSTFARATAAPIPPTGSVTWTVAALPFGTYAASAFHDADDDGDLDTNFLGVPKEAYGFSNDARARLGRPDFADAAFRFAAPRDTIRFKVE